MMLYYRLDLLGDEADPELAMIDDLVQGVNISERNTHVMKGKSIAEHWTDDAHVRIGKRYGRRLLDLVGTTTSTIFASKRLADLIRKSLQPADRVEFLPIAILDQPDRVLSRDYFVVNPLGAVDCLDLAASKLQRSDRDPSQIVRVDEPVLSANKLTEPRALFRVREEPTEYVLSTPLAEVLRADDTPNVFWKKLEVR